MQIFLSLAPPGLHRLYNVGRWSAFTKDLINACIASLRFEICKQFALHRLKMYFPTRAHGGLRLSKSLSSASGFPLLYAGSRVDKAVFLLVTPPWRVGKRLRTILYTSLESMVYSNSNWIPEEEQYPRFFSPRGTRGTNKRESLMEMHASESTCIHVDLECVWIQMPQDNPHAGFGIPLSTPIGFEAGGTEGD
jgi:hypothetical protein